MKKIITLLFLSFLGYNVQAQVTVKPGVRAGLNLASYTGSNTDSKADFYVGGLIGIKFADFYTLQPEVTYTRQGAKGNFFNNENYLPQPGLTPPSMDNDYSAQYLSFTVMNKFTLVDGFHAMVGPSLDFRVGDNFDTEYGEDIMDIDFALHGGIGYTLPIGLTIEARYKLGLVDIFGDIYEDDYYEDEDEYDLVLNSVFQLGLAYTF